MHTQTRHPTAGVWDSPGCATSASSAEAHTLKQTRLFAEKHHGRGDAGGKGGDARRWRQEGAAQQQRRDYVHRPWYMPVLDRLRPSQIVGHLLDAGLSGSSFSAEAAL